MKTVIVELLAGLESPLESILKSWLVLLESASVLNVPLVLCL